MGTQTIHVDTLGGVVSIQDNNVLSEWNGIVDYKNVRCGIHLLPCQNNSVVCCKGEHLHGLPPGLGWAMEAILS